MQPRDRSSSRTTFIGDILQEAGIVDRDTLALALDEQRVTGERLGDILVRLGISTAAAINRALAEQAGIARWDPERDPPDPALLRLLPRDMLLAYRVLPIRRGGGEMLAATPRAADPLVRFTLERECRGRVRLLYVPERTAEALLSEYLGDTPDLPDPRLATSDLGEPSEAAVSELVEALFRRAAAEDATDLHFEPEERVLRIRVRIDGLLRHFMTLPRALHAPIVARIKILADLDITETRLPQDGKLVLSARGEAAAPVSIRVSSFLVSQGEKVVCRLLEPARLVLEFADLGLAGENLPKIEKAMRAPYGMVLVSGPTGSGKTTTLYSVISKLNPLDKNIVTLEDPIEVDLPLIRQSQVNVKAGLTFSSGLRAILRQDPDVILVGEIRDAETAEIAMRAALTGHLVFSTIHTNDAIAVMARLRQLDVDPFLISSALLLTIAQRLVRRICSKCRTEAEPDPAHLAYFSDEELAGITFHRGDGCSHCGNTGYRGRIGLYELLPVGNAIRDAIQRAAGWPELETLARARGFRSLREDGLGKVRAGVTTLAEVVRVTAERS